MSDFQNNVFNGIPENNQERKEEEVKADDVQKNENAASSGVIFNSDGTYHGVSAESKESSTAASAENISSQQRVNNENSYPYGATSYSAYEKREEPEAQQYGGNPSGANNNSYPYGANSYPYGNQQNSGNNTGYYRNNMNNMNNAGYAYSENKNNGNNKKSDKGTKIFAIVAGALCVFLIVALIVVVSGNDKTPSVSDETTVANAVENIPEFETRPSSETSDSGSTAGELSPKVIYDKIRSSSVGILVYNDSNKLATEGTGVLFRESEDGKYTYVITCAHVISGKSGVVIVQLLDGKKYDATVVGYDKRTDIGLLRIEASGLSLAEIGDSTKISVGDAVYAIGNPGGVEFANSFTNGIVSALDRPVNSTDTGYTTECIQHTAAINPGNSGGALVNSFGQVIGINSMKIVATNYEGMGFSVPSSVFIDVINEIMQNGYVSNRAKLGITYMPASEYSSYGMFVAIKGLPAGSIVIYDITSDSSFIGTDVQKGDMIVSINGKALDEVSTLSEIIENSKVGDEITVELVRVYKDYTFDEFEVTVKLVEDKSGSSVEEETTSQSNLLPDGSQGSGGSYYDDFFNEYFKEFFGGNYAF